MACGLLVRSVENLLCELETIGFDELATEDAIPLVISPAEPTLSLSNGDD